MGYLNKSTITVDAILTNRGRELLAQGTSPEFFNITKFAVADDEVDYRLYRTNHPNGDPFYGSVIENMPVMEATPDETQIMRYKLVTVTGDDAPSSGNIVIPRISLNIGTLSATNILTLYNSATTTTNASTNVIFSPITVYTRNTTTTVETPDSDGYTVIIADSTLAKLEFGPTFNGTLTTTVNANQRRALVASGKTFRITALPKSGTTSVSVFGNNTGATFNFTLTTVA